MSSDGTCRFWDVRNKTCTATVQLGGEGLTIAWAGDGSIVMVGRKVEHPLTRRKIPYVRGIANIIFRTTL